MKQFSKKILLKQLVEKSLYSLERRMEGIPDWEKYVSIELNNSFDDVLVSGLGSSSKRFHEAIYFCTTEQSLLELINFHDASEFSIGAIVVSSKESENVNTGSIPLVFTNRPKLLFSVMLELWLETEFLVSKANMIHKSVKIDDHTRIGNGVSIAKDSVISFGVSLGDNVTVGRGVQIGAGVKIGDGVAVGDFVKIHPNAVIGSEGFSYEQLFNSNGDVIAHIHHTHAGFVKIGSFVEIGANTCIDRGMIDDTHIGNGTKIDNLVQIGHNVTIGNNCIIVAEVGIGGSAEIGDEVALFGQVGVIDNVKIASKTIVTGKSLVMHDLQSGKFGERLTWAGIPAVLAYSHWKRVVMVQTRLPEIQAQVKSIETRVNKIEKDKLIKNA